MYFVYFRAWQYSQTDTFGRTKMNGKTIHFHDVCKPIVLCALLTQTQTVPPERRDASHMTAVKTHSTILLTYRTRSIVWHWYRIDTIANQYGESTSYLRIHRINDESPKLTYYDGKRHLGMSLFYSRRLAVSCGESSFIRHLWNKSHPRDRVLCELVDSRSRDLSVENHTLCVTQKCVYTTLGCYCWVL